MKITYNALVLVTKLYNLKSTDFTLPITRFIKYPILLYALINRIEKLRKEYFILSKVRVFDLSLEKDKAKKDLRDKGGVYVLWCRVNGLFYVGSAIRFFSNKGRLTDYFMQGRVKASQRRG